SNIKSLKSQQEVIDENLKEYLSKSISDLEIISTPENYPTETHSVSSLAELYYLTQTLPLIKLLPGCHKTLMTDNFELALFEGKIAVLYSRIEELKRQSKWSLRQPIRYYDPFLYNKKHKRVKSFHSDNLLNEGNWMAADFKESSKFKKSCCFNMAQSIMDYWTYGKIIEINGMFKLNADINDMKKIDQSIIKNLPKFTAFDDDDTTQISGSPFKSEVSPMVSISRLLHPFEDNDDWYKIVLKDSKNSNAKNSSQGPPEYQKGLFGFQSHRRFNYLKPPKPPLIKNIEYRSPTIWLPQDDKFLIHYVAEFAFNWDLISEHLLNTSSTLKKYESNIERRNPWQCFERYIQLNEKFQFSDMKGLYAYHAQQWLEQAHRAQLTTKRRISPLGVGNESIQRGHRRLRWASMFDAMRKSMRKRETQAAKIAQRRSTNNDTGASNANPNTNVNSNGNPTKRGSDRVPTPAELSRLKFERDKSIQEAYMNQQATRSRMMAAQLNVQQQKQQQMRQQAFAQGLAKRPTTPNGTPYTPEQIQQLLQIQKQRRLMQQQQNQAAKTATSAQGNTNLNMQNQYQNKRPPSKPRIQFAPAQVSAIINSIQTKNPNLTKEQVTRLAATYLANYQQQ
ncbi:hypothetical protein HYPBUDRAFT_95866, partial [Hyphopichia burtonii NRRL Y-1933]